MKELVSIISNEWLEESELSSNAIHLLYPFIAKLIKLLSMLFIIHIVGVNIMSTSFAHDLLKHMPLTPTTKLLKSLSGDILPSLVILYVLPIQVKGTKVYLSFYIFDIIEFDMLIGQSIERLIKKDK